MGFKHFTDGIALGGIWQILVVTPKDKTHLFCNVNKIVDVIKERALFLKH